MDQECDSKMKDILLERYSVQVHLELTASKLLAPDTH